MPELDLPWVAERLTGARLRGPLLYRPRTGSTNDDALALAAAGAAEGTVVIAGEQTHGRGREQRSWFGHPDGSLLFSIILRPTLPAEHFPRLVHMAGVAVAEGCAEATGLAVGTKWPNDIMVVPAGAPAGPAEGLKVGGILLQSQAPHYAVLGIGLNVRGEAADLPAELRDTAGFLASRSDAGTLTREAVLVAVLGCLDRHYGELCGERG